MKKATIKAIPELLDLLRIKGGIIMIDAMGGQTAIAEKIIVRGGDYVLAVKDNQPTLNEEVQLSFKDQPKGLKSDYHEEINSSFFSMKSPKTDRRMSKRRTRDTSALKTDAIGKVKTSTGLKMPINGPAYEASAWFIASGSWERGGYRKKDVIIFPGGVKHFV